MRALCGLGVAALLLGVSVVVCACKAGPMTTGAPAPNREPIRRSQQPETELPVVSPQTTADISASRSNAIVRAIEKAAPAVVSINVFTVQRQAVMDPFFQDFFGFFHGGRPRYRVREREIQSVGSGFLFNDQGHILTNFHVVEGADGINSVTLPDGRNLDVELVGADPITDLAVLRARGDNLPYIPLGEAENLLIGEWVIAIGNPFGLLMNDPQPSVTVGVVSAVHRRVNPELGPANRLYQEMIQTDAAINPGNSGGPLVNADGAAVGVNTMIFSQSGGSVGLGFAIPIDRARRVADEIIRYGRRRNPWAGFRVEDARNISPRVLQQVGVRDPDGTIVVELSRESPARRAGLELGDLVTAVNGREVRQATDVDYAILNQFVGDRVKLAVRRQGRDREVSFAIEERAGP